MGDALVQHERQGLAEGESDDALPLVFRSVVSVSLVFNYLLDSLSSSFSSCSRFGGMERERARVLAGALDGGEEQVVREGGGAWMTTRCACLVISCSSIYP